EDGIRDLIVTGVQTCALPIWVTLEYVLLQGINDQPSDALRLVTLAGPLPLKVNLIPYNEAAVARYAPPSLSTARAFRDLLLEKEIGRASCRERVWRWGGEESG